jgi:hypothetical protein
MKNLMKSVFFAAFWMVGSASASMISDAPAPYGSASHTTAEWQQLGNDNTRDDGVWWSIDGGSSWGHEELTVGDQVSFRFDLWISGTGVHNYNQVKAWVDWNQDFVWANDKSEIVLEEQVFRNPLTVQPASTSILTSASFLITDDMVGDLWLRARAQCNHVPFGYMTPYGELWQGEVEDWRLTVNAENVPKPPVLPEPASILLLGAGLFGLIGVRNRRA